MLNGKASERLLSARNETKENFYATKDFSQLTTERIDLNIYITGAGALIPYKRGVDDVGCLPRCKPSQLRCQKVFMILVDVQDIDPYTCA